MRPSLSKRFFFLVLVCMWLRGGAIFVSSLSAQQTGDIAPVKLRGFGTVSSTYKDEPGLGSVLTIQCETPDLADLMLAKYLSDLKEMRDVTDLQPTGANGPIVIHTSASAATTAYRIGSAVVILSAARPDDLIGLYRKQALREAPVFSPHTSVPMYLDRWDKHGLMFYHFVWRLPQGTQVSTHDFAKDFEYSKDHGMLGQIIFVPSDHDSAEGFMDEPLWSWVMKASAKDGLPFQFDLGSGIGQWLSNRYPTQTYFRAPQYIGGRYNFATVGGPDGIAPPDPAGEQASNALYAVLHQFVAKHTQMPNLVGWLEPHSEFGLAPQDMLNEYGPNADISYQAFLRKRYRSVNELSASWYGSSKVSRWQDVKVPEVSEFWGWSQDALDLKGPWKMAYPEAASPREIPDAKSKNINVDASTSPAEWYKADFDDGSWPSVDMPGDGRFIYLPRRPAVFRRTVSISGAWLAGHQKCWLYVWHLQGGSKSETKVVLNGKEVPSVSDPASLAYAFDVSQVVRPGPNQLALWVRAGFVGYRIYLSGAPPLQYPNLSARLNVQWTDYCDWLLDLHANAIEQGMNMIRSADSGREIELAEPGLSASALKVSASAFGGEFHDTGGMAGFWMDLLPMHMRSENLPMTAEPGSAARDPLDFQRFFGRWLTEGVQGVHYFDNVSNVVANPDIQTVFEHNLPMYSLIGRFHAPKADVAFLYSDRNNLLNGFPFEGSLARPSGYFSRWNYSSQFLQLFEREAVGDFDLASGTADQYKVIIDTNTHLLTDDQLDGIEHYVRNGGIFIAQSYSGRDASAKPFTWPIERLTGFDVVASELTNPDCKANRTVTVLPTQSVVSPNVYAGPGTRLRAVVPEATPLLVWPDGTAAVGLRELGKGYVATIAYQGDASKIVLDMLNYFHIRGVVARAPGVYLRHYLSNNGLDDVWVLFNEKSDSVQTALSWSSAVHPQQAIDAVSGTPAQVNHSRDGDNIGPLQMAPGETKMLITPRSSGKTAAADWFALQTQWWRGGGVSAAYATRLIAPVEQIQRYTLDLTHDWAFLPVDSVDPARLDYLLNSEDQAVAGAERCDLGIWSLPDHPEVHHALLIKRFSVPSSWVNGTVDFSMQSSSGAFHDQGRVLLDGKEIRPWSSAQIAREHDAENLRPGTSHVLTLEVKGTGQMLGVTADAWLHYEPSPLHRINLSGPWTPTTNLLQFGETTPVPGVSPGVSLRRTFHIDRPQDNSLVYLAIDIAMPVTGVLINGRLLARNSQNPDEQNIWNVTPWLNYGGDNTVEILKRYSLPAMVRSVALEFYSPDEAP